MIDTLHALAPHELPGFIPGADGNDPLFKLVIVLLVALLMGVGVLYLKLHAIPERMAHKQNNTQLQVIALLALIALVTHNNIFWVGALLLSAIRLPDFSTPMNSIANSLEKLAGNGANVQSDSNSTPTDVIAAPDQPETTDGGPG